MTQAVFTIKDHSDITKTISYLHSNYTRSIDDGKPLVVTIKPETSKQVIDKIISSVILPDKSDLSFDCVGVGNGCGSRT